MRLTGLVYRAHHPRWAFAPDSGSGAATYGGRFNPIGVPALYTSMRLETAWLEAQQAFPFKGQPMTLCCYDVDCDDILDLTSPSVLDALVVTMETLACPWEHMVDQGREPPSWGIAETLRENGVAGIIVPSFAPGAGHQDINVVFWRWSSNPPHRVQVIDPGSRLPRNDQSWR